MCDTYYRNWRILSIDEPHNHPHQVRGTAPDDCVPLACVIFERLRLRFPLGCWGILQEPSFWGSYGQRLHHLCQRFYLSCQTLMSIFNY